MLGMTIDGESIPLMTGASWNTSKFHAKIPVEDRKLRNLSLGPYYAYEEATQKQIREHGNIEVWDNALMTVRDTIADPRWIVFRARPPHQQQNPTHLEPMCGA